MENLVLVLAAWWLTHSCYGIQVIRFIPDSSSTAQWPGVLLVSAGPLIIPFKPLRSTLIDGRLHWTSFPTSVHGLV
jgi:hypothetical protein